MSMTAQLEVRDVSAHLRGDDPRRPVIVGHDGTRVVMLLDANHAEILAQVLARYETLAREAIPSEAIDGDVWLHTMVDLLAAKAFTRAGMAPVLTLPGISA